MDNTALMTIAIAIMVALSVGGLGLAFLAPSLDNRGRANRRIKTITALSGTNAKVNNKGGDKPKDRRKAIEESLKEIDEKHKEAKKRKTLKSRIERAGLELSPTGFYVGSAAMGLSFGIISILLGNGYPISGAAAFAGGLGVPQWLLNFLGARREKAFMTEFANAIDIIVRGVKTGLPLNECLQIIARESPDPVGEEFRILAENQSVGIPLDQSLLRMYERMPVQEVNFFAIVLAIQSKTGGNLSEALGNLSRVLRERKKMAAKIKAFSSEATASASIIGSLPPAVMGLVYATTPAYITLLFTERLGNVFLIAACSSMACGIFIMRKMIKFKY